MQNNLLDITRELETLKADNNRLSAEVATMSAIVNQSGTDNHFLQQELSSFDERINELEKKANDTAYELQSLQRSQNH